MAKVRVVLTDGMRELLKSEQVAAMLRGHAEAVLAAARAGAPVETGAYRDSLTMVEEQHAGRVAVHIGSTVPYALEVEANTGNLARALDAAGGS